MDLRKRLFDGAVIPAHPLALNSQRKLDERRQTALTRYYVDAGAAAPARADPPGKGQMSEETIKVMLVDDHTLFRKGLAELLDGRDNIRVVAASGVPADAARLLDEAQPDALVLDLNMPPHGGLALLRELQAKGWSRPTLILTVSDAEDDLANAMRAGARGYLLKDMEPDDVVDAYLAVFVKY